MTYLGQGAMFSLPGALLTTSVAGTSAREPSEPYLFVKLKFIGIQPQPLARACATCNSKIGTKKSQAGPRFSVKKMKMKTKLRCVLPVREIKVYISIQPQVRAQRLCNKQQIFR
jgi:hypothetical protein